MVGKQLLFCIVSFVASTHFVLAQSDTLVPLADSVVVEIKNDTRFDDGRQLYKNDLSFLASAHTSGWGVQVRKGYNLDLFNKLYWSVGFSTIKHSKEVKISPFEGDAKGYVFGKKNTLSVLRGTFGYQKMLFEREEYKGVEVGFNLSGGFSLGLVKPVYLELQEPFVNGSSQGISIQAYDENKHSQIQIRGRAPFVYGINQIEFYPGLHLKAAVNIQYSAVDKSIRAVETGIVLDGFYKKVPIMAFSNNQQLFLNLFVSWQFGKKYTK